ncbi:MAG: hypothetical protein FD138_2868 [Planctomycetota bacterium]|nr:MAG: hypothetical protein FD138_2868 [Planctomycetota bacterium]
MIDSQRVHSSGPIRLAETWLAEEWNCGDESAQTGSFIDGFVVEQREPGFPETRLHPFSPI